MKTAYIAGVKQTPVLAAVAQGSLKILQMSALELAACAAAEAEQNPFLDPGELREGLVEDDEEARVRESLTDEEGEVFGPRLSFTHGGGGGEGEDPAAFAESSVSAYDVIFGQIRATFSEQGFARAGALALAEYLDERGFLTASLEAVSHESGLSEALLAGVLEKCRHFEPSGVFCRNITEAMLLRLKDEHGPAAELCRAMLLQGTPKPRGISSDHALFHAEAVRMLKRLRFAPFDLASAPAPALLRPECALVLNGRHKTPSVRLIEGAAPEPRFLRDLYDRLRPSARTPEEALFFRERRAAAKGLETAARKRASTLLLVAEAVAVRQADFFRSGPAFLRPLTLAQLAQETGLHESTVSRAVCSKALAIDGRVFPLDYFLSSAVKGESEGEGISSEAVKVRLRALIRSEPREKPYSDEALADLLAREGVSVARRTVMKYREALGVPASAMRKGA